MKIYMATRLCFSYVNVLHGDFSDLDFTASLYTERIGYMSWFLYLPQILSQSYEWKQLFHFLRVLNNPEECKLWISKCTFSVLFIPAY